MPRVFITEAGQAAAGHAEKVCLTRVASRAITALRNGSGDLEVIAWDVSSNGTITRRGTGSGGDVSQVSITDWPGGPGVITALRTADGSLKIIAWKVSGDGSIQRFGDAAAGPVSEVVVSSPSGFAGVITAVRGASGDLKVIAWKVSAAGVISRGDEASGGACSKLSITSLLPAGGAARFATGLRNEAGNLEIITWSVTSAGIVKRLDEAGAGPISGVALTARSTASADLFSVTRGPTGDLTVIGWSVPSNGTLKRGATAQGGNVTAVTAATWKPDVHSYVVAAVQGEGGLLKLIAWRDGSELQRNGDVTGPAVSGVAATTWSGGVLTACPDAAGNLKLSSWTLQPKGIRLLHRVWPLTPATSAPPPDIAESIERGPRTSRYADMSDTPMPGPDIPAPDVPGPDGSDDVSADWQQRFFPAVQGVDPMLAVGHQFMVVTQDHRVGFLGRDGSALPSKDGEATNLSATTFFGGFIAATNPDGTPNPDNINTLSPQTISEFYDTRVAYDAPSRRFAILSAARKPGTKDTRYYAFAVSRTEDPRDGFEQYMTTESNFRDFPRLTIHGDRLLVAHNAAAGGGETDTPVLSAYHYPSLRQGILDPPNWQYFQNDLEGAPRVFLVSHHGDTGGMSLLFDIRKDHILRIPAFALAGQPHLAPQPLFAEVTLSKPASWPGPFGVFRNKTLHTASAIQITSRVPNEAPPRDSIRVLRIPFSTITSNKLAVDAAGVVDRVFGLNAPSDDPLDKVSYDMPGLAVNQQGDAIYSYGRTGITTKQPLFPEVRYSVWLQGEAQQRRSRLLQAGSFQPTWLYDASSTDKVEAETVATSVTHAYKLDYSTAVVDPVDDHTFWFIHEYADGASNGWKTVIGVVNPTA
jgi:hypothetical protein